MFSKVEKRRPPFARPRRQRWYLQKGTPTVKYGSTFDASTSVFKLTLSQSTPAAPENLPFHIPVSFGIIDSESGEEVRG